jgi:hypothetical protein
MTTLQGYMKCFTCNTYTATSDLYVHEQNDKSGPCFYLKGKCVKCEKNKSRRLGKTLKAGYSKESTSKELLKLLPQQPPKTGGNITTETATESPSTEVEVANAVNAVANAVANADADIDGEGFWDSIKNLGKKKTFADKVGDAASKFTKSAVRSIPIVGDILADTGIVDSGINWISENIWQPIKNTFGWSLDDVLKEKLMNDDNALQDIMEKMYEIKIKTGDGLVPKYIGELRQGSTEDKALAHVLLKTLCKPKFYKFLKDENVPSSMSIIEAFTKYKSKPKPYRNQEDKAQQILSSLGYSFT